MLLAETKCERDLKSCSTKCPYKTEAVFSRNCFVDMFPEVVLYLLWDLNGLSRRRQCLEEGLGAKYLLF